MLTARMFATLLASSSSQDSSLQRNALQYAERTGNTDLLCALAGVRDLDPEVEAALAEREELDVLMAWASRKNRTKDEIVTRFSSEKRATLLYGLAEATDLPQELYAQFAKRKSVNVNWLLVENPSVDESLKTALAAQLAAGLKVANSSLYERLAPIHRSSDVVYTAFVESLSNTYALGVLIRWASEPDGASLERIQVLSAAAMRAVEAGETYTGGSLLVSLLNGELSDEARDLVEHVTRDLIETKKDSRDLYYDLGPALARSVARRTFDKAALLAVVRSARTTADLGAEAAKFEQTLRDLRIGFDNMELARVVLSNPHLDDVLLGRYRIGLDQSNALVIARRAVAEKNLRLAQEVLRYTSYLGADLFGVLYSEAESPEDLVSWICGESVEAPNYVTSSKVVAQDKAVALQVLPAATTLKSSAYADSVAEMLAEHLGEDPEKWRMFTTLADEWTGSFTALLRSTVDLSG